METQNWVNTGSGNGLVPDGTKPFPEQCWLSISEVLWHSPESNFQEMFKMSILDMSLEITHLQLELYLWGRDQMS